MRADGGTTGSSRTFDVPRRDGWGRSTVPLSSRRVPVSSRSVTGRRGRGSAPGGVRGETGPIPSSASRARYQPVAREADMGGRGLRDMALIPEKFHDLFEKRTFAHLSTLAPHSMPVWVDYNADANRMLVNTARGRHLSQRGSSAVHGGRESRQLFPLGDCTCWHVQSGRTCDSPATGGRPILRDRSPPLRLDGPVSPGPEVGSVEVSVTPCASPLPGVDRG